MIQRKAVEWHKEVNHPEDNSLMDVNQSGDVNHKDYAGPAKLEDWRDTIHSVDV